MSLTMTFQAKDDPNDGNSIRNELSPCAVDSLSPSDCLHQPSPLFSFCRHISSIHFLLGCPLLLLPFPCASIIPFSNPSDRITCPKNPSFLLSAVCCGVSSSQITSMAV